MAFKSIKVDIETLEKLNEIVSVNAQSHDSIKNAISNAIDNLWIKTCKNDTLLLIDEEEFAVKPKSDQSQYLKDITGVKGPYMVVKTFKSWVGLSDGVYKLKDCDVFVPVAWFDKIENSKEKSTNRLLISIFALMSLCQSGALLLLLL